MTISQQELQCIFCGQELNNRAKRRARLLLELKSLTPKDQHATDLALAAIRQQQLDYERDTSPGYWQRLWRALRGR